MESDNYGSEGRGIVSYDPETELYKVNKLTIHTYPNAGRTMIATHSGKINAKTIIGKTVKYTTYNNTTALIDVIYTPKIKNECQGLIKC